MVGSPDTFGSEVGYDSSYQKKTSSEVTDRLDEHSYLVAIAAVMDELVATESTTTNFLDTENYFSPDGTRKSDAEARDYFIKDKTDTGTLMNHTFRMLTMVAKNKSTVESFTDGTVDLKSPAQLFNFLKDKLVDLGYTKKLDPDTGGLIENGFASDKDFLTALTTFQYVNGLDTDGVVGPKTLARLFGDAEAYTAYQNIEAVEADESQETATLAEEMRTEIEPVKAEIKLTLDMQDDKEVDIAETELATENIADELPVLEERPVLNTSGPVIPMQEIGALEIPQREFDDLDGKEMSYSSSLIKIADYAVEGSPNTYNIPLVGSNEVIMLIDKEPNELTLTVDRMTPSALVNLVAHYSKNGGLLTLDLTSYAQQMRELDDLMVEYSKSFIKYSYAKEGLVEAVQEVNNIKAELEAGTGNKKQLQESIESFEDEITGYKNTIENYSATMIPLKQGILELLPVRDELHAIMKKTYKAFADVRIDSEAMFYIKPSPSGTGGLNINATSLQPGWTIKNKFDQKKLEEEGFTPPEWYTSVDTHYLFNHQITGESPLYKQE